MPLITNKLNVAALKRPLKLINASVVIRCIVNSDPPNL